LIQEDVKRLREMNPSMLQIKKTDETFMDLEIFNIRPENSPNDIIVTTSFQTDQSMIDSSNELYLVAIPTLQKVRQRVIDDLRGKVSPNKWLIPLAAGNNGLSLLYSGTFSFIVSLNSYTSDP
jgi:hypothetical protein